MFLKELRLKGIRSYDSAVVRFPKGSVLFAGDIGSGKSTLLYAIEFALFGTSDLDYGFLVRHGVSQAEVELSIDVDGKSVTVHRELERKKDKVVLAKTSWIDVDGARTAYTATELKREVLRLLDFREPVHPKRSSVIYRYAVFTPQEEMKRILAEKPDERLQTLRRAFRVEEYRLARDHAQDVLLPAVREQTRFLDGLVADLPLRRAAMERIATEVTERRVAEVQLGKDVEEATGVLDRTKAEMARVENLERLDREQEVRAKGLQKDVERHRATLERLAAELLALEDSDRFEAALAPFLAEAKDVRRRMEEADRRRTDKVRRERELASLEAERRVQSAARTKDEQRVRDLEVALERRTELQAKVAGRSALAERRAATEKRRSAIVGELGGLRSRRTEITGERKGLASLKGQATCPHCRQPLSPDHLRNLLEELDRRLQETEASVAARASDLAAVESELRVIDSDLEGLTTIAGTLAALDRDAAEAGRLREVVRQSREDDQRRDGVIVAARQAVASLGDPEPELKGLREREKILRGKELEAERLAAALARRPALVEEQRTASVLRTKAEQEIAELAQRQAELRRSFDPAEAAKVRRRLSTAEGDRSRREERLANARQQSARLAKEHGELTSELAGKERRLLDRQRLVENDRWMREVFIPGVESVERQLLASINADFELAFQKWFDLLVESSDLTVTVDEAFTPLVEQQGYALSIDALSGGERTAVAFAYRLALNSVVRRVCAAMKTNLLILDEPTDGFSKEQLARVQEVLRQLRCDQLIMVSHERELEGSADQVFRVVKERGISRVVAP